MLRTATLSLLLLAAPIAEAAPVTLSCVTGTGSPSADLIVDLQAGRMQWGPYRFRVTSVTDRYITAVQEKQNDVGSEVWVQDRVTGQYLRGGVGIEVSGVDKNGKLVNPHLVASTASGYCKAPML